MYTFSLDLRSPIGLRVECPHPGVMLFPIILIRRCQKFKKKIEEEAECNLTNLIHKKDNPRWRPPNSFPAVRRQSVGR